jgi:hypothetical protein
MRARAPRTTAANTTAVAVNRNATNGFGWDSACCEV